MQIYTKFANFTGLYFPHFIQQFATKLCNFAHFKMLFPAISWWVSFFLSRHIVYVHARDGLHAGINYCYKLAVENDRDSIFTTIRRPYGKQSRAFIFKFSPYLTEATFTMYRIVFRSDMKNTYPYLLGPLFSEELLQRRDVVSLSFWKFYIPYRIGAFPRRYAKLSGIQCKRIASDLILLRYETPPSRRAGSSLKQGEAMSTFLKDELYISLCLMQWMRRRLN
jgi:hypothetical protein